MLVAFSSTNFQLKVATWFHSGMEACGLFFSVYASCNRSRILPLMDLMVAYQGWI